MESIISDPPSLEDTALKFWLFPIAIPNALAASLRFSVTLPLDAQDLLQKVASSFPVVVMNSFLQNPQDLLIGLTVFCRSELLYTATQDLLQNTIWNPILFLRLSSLSFGLNSMPHILHSLGTLI